MTRKWTIVTITLENRNQNYKFVQQARDILIPISIKKKSRHVLSANLKFTQMCCLNLYKRIRGIKSNWKSVEAGNEEAFLIFYFLNLFCAFRMAS